MDSWCGRLLHNLQHVWLGPGTGWNTHPQVQIQVEQPGWTVRLPVSLLVAKAAPALIFGEGLRTQTHPEPPQQHVYFVLAGQAQNLTGDGKTSGGEKEQKGSAMLSG